MAQGIVDLLQLLAEGIELLTPLQGGGVLVEVGHRLAHAHTLTLGGQHVRKPRPGRQHILVPHQEARGLRGLVQGVGVAGHGDHPVGKALPGVHKQVHQYRAQQHQHDCTVDDFALFHGMLLQGIEKSVSKNRMVSI